MLSDTAPENQRQRGKLGGDPRNAILENHIRNHSDATPRAREIAGVPPCFPGFRGVPLLFLLESAGFLDGFLGLECPDVLASLAPRSG